jgi:hypothetical protein
MKDIWDELGIIVVIYIALIVGYSLFFKAVYNQTPEADPLGLLLDTPNIIDLLRSGKSPSTKIEIVRIVAGVFLLTVPLVISAALIGASAAAKALNPISIALSVVVPFAIYFTIFDQVLLRQAYATFEQSQRQLGASMQKGASAVIEFIANYYLAQYKFPLAAGAAILGGRVGYRLAC